MRQKNAADPGTDFVSLEFGLTLPLNRDKRREAVAEAAMAEEMVARQLDDFLNKTRLAIHDGHAQMQRAAVLMPLYRAGIIPQATQGLQAAMTGYQVGTVGFQALIDTMLILYRYEIEYYRAVADYGRIIARLEAEAGIDPAQSSE